MKDFELSGRVFIIPQVENSKEFLLQVDRDCKSLVRQKFGMFAEYDWESSTIATVTLKAVVSMLYLAVTSQTNVMGVVEEDDDHSLFVNFCGLVTIRPSHRRNEKAEKVGSINAVFTQGPRAREIAEDRVDRLAKAAVEKKVKCEEYYITGDPVFDKAWTDFDKYVRHELADKYRIILSHAYSAIAFTECFLFCLYDRMKMNLLVNPEMKTCSAIFNEFFELRAYAIPAPDGGVKIKFNLCPEKYGKCGIKDDGTTEREED